MKQLQLQVLGPFHSGTNLLLKMLIDNCHDVESKKVEISENLLSWKHTLRMGYLNDLLKENKQNVLVIIYKNVYNWLMSMAFDPVDLRMEKGLSGPCKLLNLEFENIMELYNRYYEMYKFFLEKHPHQVVVLDYHKMIQQDSPTYICSKLERIGVKVVNPQKIVNVLACSSRDKSVVSSTEALDKYDHVQQTIQKVIRSYSSISERINKDLIAYFEEM